MRCRVETEEDYKTLVVYASENVFKPCMELEGHLKSIKFTLDEIGEASLDQVKKLQESWEGVGNAANYLAHCGAFLEQVKEVLGPWLDGIKRFESVEKSGSFTVDDHDDFASLFPVYLQSVQGIKDEPRVRGYL